MNAIAVANREGSERGIMGERVSHKGTEGTGVLEEFKIDCVVKMRSKHLCVQERKREGVIDGFAGGRGFRLRFADILVPNLGVRISELF